MVSQDNLKKLGESGGQYFLCRPMHRGDEVTHAVLQRPGRYQQVADSFRVKAVVVGAGERRRRYVVCPNPQEEKRPEPIASRFCMNSKPSWPLCEMFGVRAGANACANCGRAVAMVGIGA